MSELFRVKRTDLGVTFVGVDMGGVGQIVAEKDKILVVKFPAGKHWSGRGSQSYHSAKTIVLERDRDSDWYRTLVGWQHKRKS